MCKLLVHFENTGQIDMLTLTKQVSPVAWTNINLNGIYSFNFGQDILKTDELIRPITEEDVLIENWRPSTKMVIKGCGDNWKSRMECLQYPIQGLNGESHSKTLRFLLEYEFLRALKDNFSKFIKGFASPFAGIQRPTKNPLSIRTTQ